MNRSLHRFEAIRKALMLARWLLHTRFWGMHVDRTAIVSLKAHLDKTHPTGVHVGPHSYVAFGAVVLAHDRTRGLYLDTVIGRNCFIGARSMILPGVRVGDNCIVGAGSVVTKDVPPRTVVAGNPASVLHEGIDVIEYGRFRHADMATIALKASGKIIP
ncbi:acyltransferase [Geodermatophilus sp. DSM 44513]|uniref:acyltransferase n=1 Tax=Geodermatophilus sp. DSM 44513 TaxID=1528104 RepID=UPI0028F709F3|nr:acyltransferase [Geodermatophilus sp. DSM 44513]WNV76008.1 acyltransferase [Geodermatophilus sp. DSM 44513]